MINLGKVREPLGFPAAMGQAKAWLFCAMLCEFHCLYLLFYFCVACESQGWGRKYVEVLAASEQQAIHKASKVHPDCSYRLLVPEPIVKYGLASNHG